MAGEKEGGRVFAEYFIGDAVVRLREHENSLLYEVDEPKLNDRVKKLLDRAMEENVRRVNPGATVIRASPGRSTRPRGTRPNFSK